MRILRSEDLTVESVFKMKNHQMSPSALVGAERTV